MAVIRSGTWLLVRAEKYRAESRATETMSAKRVMAKTLLASSKKMGCSSRNHRQTGNGSAREAAARQFVRKVTGVARPGAATEVALERAVADVARSVTHLLAALLERRYPPATMPPHSPPTSSGWRPAASTHPARSVLSSRGRLFLPGARPEPPGFVGLPSTRRRLARLAGPRPLDPVVDHHAVGSFPGPPGSATSHSSSVPRPWPVWRRSGRSGVRR